MRISRILAGFLISLLLFEAVSSFAYAQSSTDRRMEILLKIAKNAENYATRLFSFALSLNISIPVEVNSTYLHAQELLENATEESNVTLAMKMVINATKEFRRVIGELWVLIKKTIRAGGIKPLIKEELMNVTADRLAFMLEKCVKKLNDTIFKLMERGIEIPENLSAKVNDTIQRANELIEEIRVVAEEGNLTQQLRDEAYDIMIVIRELIKELNKLAEETEEKAVGLRVAINRTWANFNRYVKHAKSVNLTEVQPILDEVNSTLSEALAQLEAGNISAAAKLLGKAHRFMADLAHIIHKKASERAWERFSRFKDKIRGIGQTLKELTEMAGDVVPSEVQDLIEEYMAAEEEAERGKDLRKAVKALERMRNKCFMALAFMFRVKLSPAVEDLVGINVTLKGFVVGVNETSKKALVWGVARTRLLPWILHLRRSGRRAIPPVFIRLWIVDYSGLGVDLHRGDIILVRGNVTMIADYGLPLIEAQEIYIIRHTHFAILPKPIPTS